MDVRMITALIGRAKLMLLDNAISSFDESSSCCIDTLIFIIAHYFVHSAELLLGKCSLESLPFLHQVTQLFLTVNDNPSHLIRFEAYKFANLSYCQRSRHSLR